MSRFYEPKRLFRKADGPCKDCPDRYVGCHSKCEKYINWKREWEAFSNRAQAERDLNGAFISMSCHTHKSISNQMHKRK